MDDVYCVACSLDCGLVYIQCNQCDNYDSCLECFSNGLELFNHLNNHSYTIKDKGSFSICSSSWTCWKDYKLINLIVNEGFENWNSISDKLRDTSSPEAMDHYNNELLENSIFHDLMKINKMFKLIHDSQIQRSVDLNGFSNERWIPFFDNKSTIDAKNENFIVSINENFELSSKSSNLSIQRDEFDIYYDDKHEEKILSIDKFSASSEAIDAITNILLIGLRQNLLSRRKRCRISYCYGLFEKYNSKVSSISDSKNLSPYSCMNERLKVFSQILSPNSYKEMLISLNYQYDLQKNLQSLLLMNNMSNKEK